MSAPRNSRLSAFRGTREGTEDDVSITAPDALPKPKSQDSASRGGGDLEGLRLYLRDAGRHRRVSTSEERRLLKQPSEVVTETGQRKTPPGGALVDPQVDRQRLIEENLMLVVAVARRYEGLGLPLGDLIQEGNLGLIAAARRFEPRRHDRFSSYAAGWIRQTICRGISQKSRMIRIPVRRLELRRWAAQTEEHVEQRHRDEASRSGTLLGHTDADDARVMGVELEVLRSTIRLLPDMVSLDAPPASGGRPLRESLPDATSADPLEIAAAMEARRRVHEALGRLPTRLRFIIRRRYGLAGSGAASLADIGCDLQITAERVRQLESRALNLLRRDLARGRIRG